MKRTVVVAVIVYAWTLAFAVSPAAAENATDPLHSYRCNTHTHTSTPPHSDVNRPLEFVANWYRSHGYQCLVITDHEFLTDVAPLNQRFTSGGGFLLIQGQEITQALADPSRPGGVRHLHVNGIGIDRAIMPMGYPKPAHDISARQAYERNVSAVLAEGGIVQINHPNLVWSVGLEDLITLSDPFLLEVWNAFPTSNNLGGIDDSGHTSPSTEELWDALLTNGKVVWAVASDDAHDYQHLGDEGTPSPGKAWIMVQARSLTAGDILDALSRGNFYATTGIVLAAYTADDKGISIRIAPNREWSAALTPSGRYFTRFVGANGRVLAEVPGMAPQYRFAGSEGYVRAAIVDSDGRRAWTQPFFLDSRRSRNVFATRVTPGTTASRAR